MSTLSVYSTDYTAIYVHGDDAKSYLQGQLTQDVNDIDANTWRWAGHCNAKGKLWACFRISQYQQGYVLICSNTEAKFALAELKKYAVFSKVDIEQLDTQVFGMLAPKAELVSHLNIDISGNAQQWQENLVLLLDDQRALFIGDSSVLPEPQNSDEFACAQIKAGEPSLNTAAIDAYVPQMVNLQALGGISFNKGCYTGQETVARMKYLGKNKRAMFVLRAEHEGVLAPQLDEDQNPFDLERQVGDNWRRAGTLIAQASANGELFGLAVLPNDTEQDVQLRAKHAPQVLFTIAPLPYSLTED
ncbi:CAF17-like 4Fe-4S cluster assembly/insertion protein YgfZ [Pseudoalteromonas sp. T1lg48]|uniref:CAF17-like 4Fe-4S cluster assembly/insertion protein YgfZ n=1 Tax=Pseudoalteromonas sp. T1lg48 TaxID=2077100 RepID=UPI000CF689D4|nr:folate-binding protein YgfZ [Pseudoalteromonas sp. T1lg48]